MGPFSDLEKTKGQFGVEGESMSSVTLSKLLTSLSFSGHLQSFSPQCLRLMSRDFPGGLVVKNLPSNAGYACSITGWGTKIPYATRHLSLPATIAEPVCLN